MQTPQIFGIKSILTTTFRLRVQEIGVPVTNKKGFIGFYFVPLSRGNEIWFWL